jgi:hypothetical protein
MSLFALWCCRIAGGCFLAISAYLVVQRLLFLARCSVAQGEVIGQRPTYHKPVPVSGRTVSVLGALGAVAWLISLFQRAQEGQTEVDLREESRRPKEAGRQGQHAAPGRPQVSYPRVRFTVGGRSVEFTHPAGSGTVQFPTGTRVRVLYLPGWPEGAMISSFAALWVPALLTAILGGALLGAGLFVAVRP